MDEQSTLAEFDVGDSPQTNRYECGVCGRSFDSAGGRGVHMGHKHDKDEIKTELIAKLHNLAERLGRIPGYDDMQQKGEYSASTYETHLGTWNNALEEAGLEINEQFSKDKTVLLDELKRLTNDLGRTPTAQDMRQEGNCSVGAYQTEFDSWNNALKEAGLETHVETDIDKSDLLSELNRLADELGRTPGYDEMTSEVAYGVSTYEREFGSWNEALREAGLEINEEGAAERKIPDSELLNELNRLANELGQTPVREDMSREGAHGYTVYERRFESWNKALRKAGLMVRRERNVDETTLLNELERLADELGRTPTYDDMTQQGGYGAGIYEQRFGSWIGALDEANLEHRNTWYPDDLTHKVRSTYEEDIAEILLEEGVEYEYEPESSVIEYGENRTYTPDFVTNQYVIEVKGFTHAVERQEHTGPDEIDKAEVTMEQLSDKQYVVIQNKGVEIPADKHMWWENRDELRELL